MAWVAYDTWRYNQFTGSAIDFSSDTLKLMLLTSSYSPDQTADAFLSDIDVPTNEVSGTGYTDGGTTLANLSTTVVAHIFTFDCDDITFTADAAGFTNARIAVLFKETGDTTTSNLITYYDLGSDRSNVGLDLVLSTPSGIFTVS